VCLLRMLPCPARGPAARSARAMHMLPVGEQAQKKFGPDTSEHTLNIWSTDPDHMLIDLIKQYSIDDTLRL
jgi:hypothetical protein